MNTFYSILYVPIRPSLDEKVSIGLFLRHDYDVFFKYSSSKLNIIKQLIPSSAFGLLKAYLKNMESNIIGLDNIPEIGKLQFLDESSHRFLEESYFCYLSEYSNNLISFSLPKAINVDFNRQVFEKLFEKYVFKMDSLEPDSQQLSVQDKVKESLFPKIIKHVNLERHLTSNEIPNLFAPVTIDFIGKNDMPVVGHSFDFSKKEYFLDSEVARYIGLIKAFEINGIEHGQYFVLGKEPIPTTHPNQHRTWKTIKNSSFLEFVPLNEIDKIYNYMTSHNVLPFFE